MLVDDFWSGLEELNDVTKYLPGQGLKLTKEKLVPTFYGLSQRWKDEFQSSKMSHNFVTILSFMIYKEA